MGAVNTICCVLITTSAIIGGITIVLKVGKILKHKILITKTTNKPNEKNKEKGK